MNDEDYIDDFIREDSIETEGTRRNWPSVRSF